MYRATLPVVEGGPGGENLTLTESELEACRHERAQGGRRLRAFCPFHGSDHQRSLAVNIDTGDFTALLVVPGDARSGLADGGERRDPGQQI